MADFILQLSCSKGTLPHTHASRLAVGVETVGKAEGFGTNFGAYSCGFIVASITGPEWRRFVTFSRLPFADCSLLLLTKSAGNFVLLV